MSYNTLQYLRIVYYSGLQLVQLEKSNPCLGCNNINTQLTQYLRLHVYFDFLCPNEYNDFSVNSHHKRRRMTTTRTETATKRTGSAGMSFSIALKVPKIPTGLVIFLLQAQNELLLHHPAKIMLVKVKS